jgi:ABC-2 type transport system ATP-binding protein
MIEAKGLSKRYGDIVAVDDVSFSVGRGEVVGFLGPNGAGKTTTMRLLTGFLPPTDGTAVIAGHDIFEDPLAARRSVGPICTSWPASRTSGGSSAARRWTAPSSAAVSPASAAA